MLRAISFSVVAAGFTAVAFAFAVPPGKQAQIRRGPPAGIDMVQTFSDDFTGNAVNGRAWNFNYGPRAEGGRSISRHSLWSNGEAEVYVDKSYLNLGIDPFSMADGVVTITARPLPPAARDRLYAELAHQPELLTGRTSLPRMEYSSGALTTRDIFQQRYGYFEIRAKWSAGKGVWPAFWLLPADGAWPPELDILEAHGDKPGTTFQTFHPGTGPNAEIRTQTDGSQQEFHTYGALWLPNRIDFYVDNVKTGSVVPSKDMDRPMYLLANLAIGGYWPGYPDAGADFEATMAIDYIKAWQFRACIDARKPCTAT